MSRDKERDGTPPPREAGEESEPDESAKEPDKARRRHRAGASAPPPDAPRRGLRRSRPISVIPEVADIERGQEKRRRFFTRPASGDSGVQSASGLRRRWRWFRGSSGQRPPSDLTDTEARAQAAKSAAAELRSRLKEGEGTRPKPPPPTTPPRSRAIPGSERPPAPTSPLPRAPSASEAANPAGAKLAADTGSSADARTAAEAGSRDARPASDARTSADAGPSADARAAAEAGVMDGRTGAQAGAADARPAADARTGAEARAAEARMAADAEPRTETGDVGPPRRAASDAPAAAGPASAAREKRAGQAAASGAKSRSAPRGQAASSAGKPRAAGKQAKAERGKKASDAGARLLSPRAALRLWRRDVQPDRPPAWHRHDLLVIVVGLALFATGIVAHHRLATPALMPLDQLGLHLSSPAGWLPARRIGRPAAGLVARRGTGERAADPDTGAPETYANAAALPHHVQIQSALDPAARLEIRIVERPTTGNLRSALVLERVSRHGEALWAGDSADRTIGGRDWVRTSYRYAYKGSKSDAPRIATAIEYATINGRLLYSVTLHGVDDEAAARLEALLVPTLAVDTNHPAAVGVR